jgi:hypothetical protein
MTRLLWVVALVNSAQQNNHVWLFLRDSRKRFLFLKVSSYPLKKSVFLNISSYPLKKIRFFNRLKKNSPTEIVIEMFTFARSRIIARSCSHLAQFEASKWIPNSVISLYHDEMGFSRRQSNTGRWCELLILKTASANEVTPFHITFLQPGKWKSEFTSSYRIYVRQLDWLCCKWKQKLNGLT